MKHKLPCELIRDLLPSYVDELTSRVTNELVEEHVADCADCKGALDAMREPEKEPITDTDKKEIDFLKKTRKRTQKIVIGSVVAMFAIFIILMFANIFMIGEPLRGDSLYCTAGVDGKVLNVEATMMDSARVPSKIKFEEEEPGIINVSCTAVLATPWNNMGVMTSEYTSETEIKLVKVDDRIIWADGEDILAITSAVYATRHPYVGDMSANMLPTVALNMVNYLGGFSNELQTKEEPYGWTFVLDEEVSSERVPLKEKMMKSYAYVLLAVVENLGEVTFEYVNSGQMCELTITTDEASDYIGYNIKDCYDDILLLQNLICRTGLDAYAFMDTEEVHATMEMSAAIEAQEQRQTAEEQAKVMAQAEKQAQKASKISSGEFQIELVNNADDDVMMLGLSYGLDGDWKGSQSGGYAAEDTSIRRGDSVTFVFYPQDFELTGWSAETYAEFKASVEDLEGNSYPMEPSFRVPVKGGAVYTYILSGNAEDGYVIGQ